MATLMAELGKMLKTHINFRMNLSGFLVVAAAPVEIILTLDPRMEQKVRSIQMMLQLLALAAGAGVATNLHGP